MTDLAARYARAEALLPNKLPELIKSPRVNPNWIRDTETFWYRNKTSDGHEFVLVDAEARTKRPAFDHARMADALNTVVDNEVEAKALPFFGIDFRDRAVRVVVEGKRIEVTLDSYAAAVLGPVHMGETPSPDGRWSVGVSDHNLYVRNLVTDEIRELTSDGAEAFTYGGMTDPASMLVMRENLGGFSLPPMVLWSPDSTRFFTHRLDQRDVELMHLVRSSPAGGGRPELLSYRYALPGDEHQARSDYFVFNAETGEATQAKTPPIHTPFIPAIAYGWVSWNHDGTKVHFLSTERGDCTGRLHELDAETGEVTVLVEETVDTHIMFAPLHHKNNIRVLASGEVLWWSERTGWGHLYLYGADGSVTALTSGDWLVRDVVGVDEDARRVVFTAAGREPGTDAYLQELYAVSLDGGEVTTITSDGLDHDTVPSKSGRHFVDVMSSVDVPTVSVLRDAEGSVVLELAEADATELLAAGWSPPERVKVKAADGVTDIWCAIHKPHDFDPTQTYPVIDEIYSGPQTAAAPTRFPLAGGPPAATWASTAIPALGFVWVAVDGRGTALRHKAFMDHNRLVGDGDYVADHVAAIRQLAETRPWMDLDRVGIFGESCGGLNSAKAIMMEPDFFKVAVSTSGNHDDRINHAWWGEKFYGLTDEFDFGAHANESLVDNLKGKLLLGHGEMDDNAVPHATMRLVDALMQANKDFDLLMVPNHDHPMGVRSGYWIRRRWDYFVQHLMGETPPAYRVEDVPLNLDALAGLLGS